MRWQRTVKRIVLGVGLMLFWAARPGEARREGAQPPAGRADRLQVQGVATCASSSCHGGHGEPGRKGSEYSTWVAHDPHARAYSVLFDQRARNMARQLWPRDENRAKHPEREPLCLSCHVHPDPHLTEGCDRVKGTRFSERFAPSDGVGCEACHGPAEKWRPIHSTDAWKGLSVETKARLGFVNTKDLRVRAEACVRCHVGDRDMDVNHDLIAAGHPRLRFEYGAYLANYTGRHWKESADRQRNADHQAWAWLVGQLVSAKAALELLAHRAEGTKRPESKPWPEFAEYNCAACHHALKGGPGRGKTARRAGDLPWGTWYLALLPELAAGAPRGPGRFDTSALARSMQVRQPDVTAVSAQARKLALAIDGWLARVETAPITLAQWEGLLKTLASADKSVQAATWEEAAQRFLGLAALLHGLNDLDGSFPKRHAGLKGAIEEMRKELHRAFPGGKETLDRTPRDYDPGRMRTRLEVIRERSR